MGDAWSYADLFRWCADSTGLRGVFADCRTMDERGIRDYRYSSWVFDSPDCPQFIPHKEELGEVINQKHCPGRLKSPEPPFRNGFSSQHGPSRIAPRRFETVKARAFERHGRLVSRSKTPLNSVL
jgi:hypothetical protein